MVALGVGTCVGAAVALVLSSRFPSIRKAGALGILLAPLLVFLAPFLWIRGSIALLQRWPKQERRRRKGG